MKSLSRRGFVGAVTAALPLASSWAQAPAGGSGLLARLQAAKKVRIGIANQPPYSALNFDGTITGLAPTVAKQVLAKLGITELEASLASYGELIPGMLAGRWDFVAASLTMTKERCSQVLFSDPISLEGTCIASVPGQSPEHPKTMADLVRINGIIGVSAGGAQYRALLAGGVKPGNILQFAEETTLVDGLVANRFQFAWVPHLPLLEVMRKRKLDLDVVFPIKDYPTPGSANAFRLQDTDFYAGYQRELRAMKASGEFSTIVKRFGFEAPPELLDTTAAQQCQLLGA